MADRPAISFSPFLIPPDVDVLYRDGQVVPLQPHAVRVLRYLAENHGRVVSKHELLDAVWADTFTTDGVLKKAVLQVRRALGDDAGAARFVETHHARGYCFIAPVDDVGAPGAEPPRGPEPPSSNLPFHATSFVGREREIETIVRALATTRLLTLNGPGGIGKTRLAIEAARHVLGNGLDDVWLVELAELADPSLVPLAVAGAVGAREDLAHPVLETLREHLRPRRVLLVLDNCEHMVGACAALVDALLQTCPSLRVLTTSREALKVPGETLYPVPPLSLPSHDVTAEQGGNSRSEAVALFLDRVRSSAPELAVAQDELSAVAELCRRLDGIPLAIELAAARRRMLSADQILERLADRFHLLTEGGRTTPARHRTLRATIDWSYDLLPEAERLLFAELSIFSGGWTLADAESVCGADETDTSSAARLRRGDVLDLLEHLVTKSFVYVERGEEPRYGMLETLREYAAKQLDSDEHERLARRHAERFLHLAERGRKATNGPDELVWFDRLECEHDNLRSAFAWCMSETGDADVGIRLALELRPFLYRRHRLTESRTWFETALTRMSNVTEITRARVLVEVGIFAFRQGEWQKATEYFEEARVLERDLEDAPPVGASTYLGMIAAEAGEYERARALHEESLARQRRIGASDAVAVTLNELGVVAQMLGDYDGAVRHFEESAALSRERGDQHQIAIGRILRASLEIERGNPERAVALLDEASVLARTLKNAALIAVISMEFGSVRARAGDLDGAAAAYCDGLEILRARDDRPGIASALEGLAGVAAAAARPARAIRLAAAAAGLRATTHTRPMPVAHTELDRWTTAAREALGEDEAARELAAGEAMSLDEAIGYALERVVPAGE